MTPRSRTAIAVMTALILALVLSGCTTKSSGVVARVNGEDIKADELQRQFDQMKKASPTLFEGKEGKARETEYKAKILDSLITVKLVEQAAAKLGVTVSDKQISDYVKQLEDQYGGKSGLQEAMKQAGITEAQLNESVRSRLLYDAVREKVTKPKTVSDDEARAYYDKNPATFSTSAQVNAAHILVAEKDKALAEKLFGQVKGGEDLAKLAAANSIDPGSKDKGGDLGWASPTTYVTEFATAVSEMKVGEVRLVHTEFGWHVIKLLGTKPAEIKPFEQVKDQIAGYLAQEESAEQFTKYVQDLKDKAKIEILDTALAKAIEGTQTVSPTP